MLLGIFFTTTLLHSQSNLNLTEEEKAWLSFHPVLRLGFDASRPPYDFSNKKGDHKGVLSSYYNYFETLLGIEFITVKADSWSELMHLARQGEVDIISGLIQNPQRENYLDFSTSLFSVPLSVLASKDNLVFEGLEDFENKRVAMVTSHGAIEFMQKSYPHLPIITHDSLSDAFKALENGLLDAIIGETHSLRSYMFTNDIKKYHIAHTLPESYTLHIGTNKSLPHLSTILQKALNTIDYETKQSFHQTWLHSYKTHFFKVWHGFSLALMALIGWIVFALKNKQLSNNLNIINEKKKHAVAHLEVVSKALNAGVWIWHINEDKYITDDTFTNILGYEKNEILPTFDGFMSLIASEDKSLVIAALKRHIERTDSFYSVYCKLMHKNGQYQMFHSFGGILANDKYGLPNILGGCHILSQANNLKPENTLLDKPTGLLSQYCYHAFVPLFLQQARRECFGVSLILFRLHIQNSIFSIKNDSLKQFGSFLFETILAPSGFAFYMGGNVFCTIYWCDDPKEAYTLVEDIQNKSALLSYKNSLQINHGVAFMMPGSFVDEAALYQSAYTDLSQKEL